MKLLSLLFMILCVVGADATDRAYTASTPAAPVVREFLGISMTDSIDFIRWELSFTADRYKMNCQYGISKPNTNGFINGGAKVELNGTFLKEKNHFLLQHGIKVLRLAEINHNLLHIMNAENNLLVGNGGWSYTLNNMTPTITDQLNLIAKQTPLKDSIAFQGRTPCGIPGILASGVSCYKLKWSILLYAKANKPDRYKVVGTPWYKEGGRRGVWEIVSGKNNRIIYQLNDEKGKGFIFLVKLDENILAFSDANGNLLVGDLDFSYVLNRRL